MQQNEQLDTFLQWCSRERDTLCKITLGQQWNAKQRLAVEQFIACFDELRAQLRKPLYKPLLATKLEFPAGWAALAISFSPGWCCWYKFSDVDAFTAYMESAAPPGNTKLGFFTWDELHNALLGPEKENRQLHVMADLISWYCIGTNGVQLNTSQLEIF